MKWLEHMVKDLRYTTTSDTNGMTQLLLRTIRDLREVEGGVDVVDGESDSRAEDDSVMSGKEILAASYQIKQFLTSLVEKEDN